MGGPKVAERWHGDQNRRPRCTIVTDIARADDAGDAGIWCVEDGKPIQKPRQATYNQEGVERLTYSNPFNLEIERVWFDGKIVYAVESGEVELEFDEHRVCRDNTLAMEYQIVYAVELDERGKLKDGRDPERVEGQFNIYDSVPGMSNYSPLWQFNYVVVPREYLANTLRSERDCLDSGYPILKSTVVEN
jgi:hypothetical protein